MKIWITGIGIVSPAGAGMDAVRRAMEKNECRRSRIADWDVGIVDDASLENIQDSRQVRRMARVSQFALSAAKQALTDAGMELDPNTPHDDTGIVCATTHMATNYGLEFTEGFLAEGKPTPGPTLFSNGCLNAIGSHISLEFKLTGCNHTVVGGMNVGLQAVAAGARILKSGSCSAVLCVGCEELSEILVGAYAKFRLVPPMLPAEGAAAILLETEERATARGAKAKAELLSTWSAHGRDVKNDVEGRNIARALEAVCKPEEVSFYSSCANGTDLDEIESRAVDLLLKKEVKRTAVKRVLGEGFAFGSLAQAALLPEFGKGTSVACSMDRRGAVSAVCMNV